MQGLVLRADVPLEQDGDDDGARTHDGHDYHSQLAVSQGLSLLVQGPLQLPLPRPALLLGRGRGDGEWDPVAVDPLQLGRLVARDADGAHTHPMLHVQLQRRQSEAPLGALVDLYRIGWKRIV